MLELDIARAQRVASRLLAAHKARSIFGPVTMPEESNRPVTIADPEDHLRFITLTVSIDYMRDADQLWQAARHTHEDPATRYLFDPITVANTGLLKITQDMQRYRLSKKQQQDAQTWQRICTTLATYFEGRVQVLISRAGTDAVLLLSTIRSPRYRSGFPFLKGPKIGPLWVRMLRDNCAVPLRRLADVPLPVDIHTAQATLQTGCVRAGYSQGRMDDLRNAVQRVWRDALRGATDGTIPLHMDSPLWLLSRRGCRSTTGWPCQLRRSCPVAEDCQHERLWLTTTNTLSDGAGEWTITGA